MKKYTILLLFILFIFPDSILAQTVISGGDVGGVWSLTNSPYIIEENITVYRDSFLIIEPGVEIRFGNNVMLNVYSTSTLTAEGTPQAPILFTSNAENPAPGDWSRINNSGNREKSSFKHCIVEYADLGLFCYGWASGCSSGANLSRIDSCEIRFNNTGIFCAGLGSTTSGCIPIAKTGYSAPVITWNKIHHNVNDGIYLSARDGHFANGYVEASISRNIIEENGDNGIECAGNDPVNPKIFHNLIQNNTTSAIEYRANHDSSRFEIYNNIIIQNTVGIQSDSGRMLNIRYNNIWDNNLDYSGINKPVTDISVDPLFQDLGAKNYLLQCSSPCINSGDPNSSLDSDGSIADIGLYGNQGAPIPRISGESIFCFGDSVELSGPPGLGTYIWSTGDTSSTIFVSDSGQYNLIVGSSSACLSMESEWFSVIEKPIVGPPKIEKIESSLGGYLESDISGERYQWYLDGDSIPDSDQINYIPLAYGNYQVQVWQDGCLSEISDIYSFFATSIYGDLFEAGYTLYPNPVSNMIFLEGPTIDAQQITLTVFDINGQNILKKTLRADRNQFKAQIDLSQFSIGLYWISLNIGGDRYLRQKFIKTE